MKFSAMLVCLAALVGVSYAVTTMECRAAGRMAARRLVNTEFSEQECDLSGVIAFVTQSLCTTEGLCETGSIEMCMARVERRSRRALMNRFCSEPTPSPTPMCSADNPIAASINFGTIEVPGFELFNPDNLSAPVNLFGPRGPPPAIFQEHIWRDGNFRYFIPGLPVGRYYFVLFFSELVPSLCVPGARVFDVAVSMNPAMNGIDVFSGAGCRTPYTVEGIVTTTRRGLVLRFLQGPANNPFISAVQVFSC